MRKTTSSTAIAALTLMFSTAAPADQKRPDSSQTSPMTAPQDDHAFAMHMAQHHRDGIAMADICIAQCAGDQVKSMARRIKADQQKDLAALEGAKGHHGASGNTMVPKDSDMERGMARLKAAKGTEADRMFLDMMLAHHASAMTMIHGAMPKLQDADLKSKADEMFTKQAREIGELQRLRPSKQSAQK